MGQMHFELRPEDRMWKCDVSVYSPDENPAIIIKGGDDRGKVLISYEELCKIKDKIDRDWFDGKPPKVEL